MLASTFAWLRASKFHPINQLENIEGTCGIEYVGYIEAKLSLPMGTHTFEMKPS